MDEYSYSSAIIVSDPLHMKRSMLMARDCGIESFTREEIPYLWIAYEPVWSIGVDGTPASSAYAEEMHGP